MEILSARACQEQDAKKVPGADDLLGEYVRNTVGGHKAPE
jgi:hypothetical protein